MKNSDIILIIEARATELWRGFGTNIDVVTNAIDTGVDNILNTVPKMKAVDIDFPLEYISSAMRNMSKAIQLRDDYLLADNLYYEWREIFLVFEDILAEL